jgi:hypothetical protein
LLPDGRYERLHPLDGVQAVNSQEWLLTRWKPELKKDTPSTK